MKRLALFFLSLTISLGWALAQNRTITGTVISSEDNEPVIAANVVVEGNASIGVVTDQNGKFKISVPANAKRLVFSYVGLKTQTVEITNVMKVIMRPDSEMLGDVVVVGYGSAQKISTVSGSVARVSGEKIAERPVANVMDALQGQVAGMQVQTTSGDPNQVASVKIHGSGSLGASSAPLYIVDGMQTDLSVVSSMNPNDFESITVLKDAASTSIFGARAANGVILITTKRGKSDEAGGRIVFNAQYGISSLVSRKPMEQIMTTPELLAYQAKHGLENNTTVGDLVKFLSEGGYALHDPSFQKSFDWLEYYMGKKAPTVQADLSMSGGSTRTQYYLSFGYYSQEGISIEPSKYRKFSGRVNLDSRVKDWLKVGVNTSGSYGVRNTASFAGTNYSNTGTFGSLMMAPYYSPYDADGKPRRGLWKTINWERHVSQAYANEFIGRVTDDYQSNIGAYLQLTPIEGLTLKSQAGIDFSVNHYTSHLYPGFPQTSDLLGRRTEQAGFYLQSTLTNTAEYKFNVADDHSFTALLGQEWVEYSSNAFNATARGLENPNFFLLGNGRTESYLVLPDQSQSAFAYLSFFGRLNYGWKDVLFFDASLRNDQSSRFGSNKRSAMFYSLGSMFDLRRAFLEDTSWLDALRLRASWGTTGNSSIPLYAYQALIGSTKYTNSLGLLVTSFGNPDLSWETQGNLNIGVNAEMFESRLRAELDYYLRTTSDMLIDVPLGYSTGFSSRYENVGSMYNTGIDLTLSYDIIQTKDWKAYVSTTFNYNIERITKLFSGLNEYVLPGTSIHWGVGHAQRFHMAQFAGLNSEGKQTWYLPDGSKTDVWDPLLLERPTKFNLNPPINGGFSLGASWKGLALDADWAYVLGKWTINNDRYFLESNTRGFLDSNRSKKLMQEWEKPGDENTTIIPKYGEGMQFDDRLIENASFLRLKNLRLSYTLPSSIFANNGVITGAKVYVLGRNLLTVTKFTGFDPEAARNVTLNQFPNTMQIVGGIQLTF